MSNIRLSVSQIKKYMKSPSQRAGEYILWIKDEFKNDALHIGSAFHKYCETGNYEEAVKIIELCEDQSTALDQFYTLTHNFDKFDLTKWEAEIKMECELWWVPFVWYIDDLTDYVTDYKSVSSLSKKDDKPAMRQAQSNYDEYMLQAYIYMKGTGKPKARFVEVMKKNLKTRPDEYWQIIEFEMSQELEDYMNEKYQPIIKEMIELYNKHNVRL